MESQDDLYDLPPGIGDTAPLPALPRCWPETDTIKTAGETRGCFTVCIDWARGSCSSGVNCSLRHSLPKEQDEVRALWSADGLAQDIFGRKACPLTATSAFNPLTCSIIHIVRGVPAGNSQHDRRRLLERGFSEWGAIAHIWFLADANQAYVKFKWRSTAQVVLEALQGRPLFADDEEGQPLELAWCTVDPAQVQARQGREMAMLAAHEARERREAVGSLYARFEQRERGAGSGGAGSGGGGGGGGGSGKRPRAQEQEVPAHSKAQATAGSGEWAAWMEAETPTPINAVTDEYPGGLLAQSAAPSQGRAAEIAAAVASSAAAAPTAVDSQADLPQLPDGWCAGVDPNSGYRYFYHIATGKSQWHLPTT